MFDPNEHWTAVQNISNMHTNTVNCLGEYNKNPILNFLSAKKTAPLEKKRICLSLGPIWAILLAPLGEISIPVLTLSLLQIF